MGGSRVNFKFSNLATPILVKPIPLAFPVPCGSNEWSHAYVLNNFLFRGRICLMQRPRWKIPLPLDSPYSN